MGFKPQVGDVLLNKYEIISLVGEGAFGAVYRARDRKLDRIVAIKFINAVKGVLERFADELEAIKGLDHPNIVRLYDFDILKEGVPCMVMEFVNGREVGDVLVQDGPFDIVRICEIALQVVDALVETHKHGIIHCDLKPENIMLTSVGARADVVKLIDFGVASMLTKTADPARAKLLVGTPQYMAPEQIQHGELGPWTDIYAMGLILIELFTGQFVFDAPDPRDILRMQLFNKVTIPDNLACTELGPIIAKAVEKDSTKRYRSTQQFYNDLNEAAQSIQAMKRQKAQRRPKVVSARSRALPSIFAEVKDVARDDNGFLSDVSDGQSQGVQPSIESLGLGSLSMSLNALSVVKGPLDFADKSVADSLIDKDQKPESVLRRVPQSRSMTVSVSPMLSAQVPSDSAQESNESGIKQRILVGALVVFFLVMSVVAAVILFGGHSVENIVVVNPDTRIEPEIQVNEAATPETTAAKPVKAAQPKPVAKTSHSTLKKTAGEMVATAARSTVFGVSPTAGDTVSYKILGTPPSASIYVERTLVCHSTPCTVHIFGEPSDALIEISDGNHTKEFSLGGKNPVVVVLGN